MNGILIYSDKPSLAAELVGFTREGDHDVTIVTFDPDDAAVLVGFGASKVVLLDGDSDIPENNAKALAGLIREWEVSLFAVGATSCGRDLAARVAGYLGCGMASDVSAVHLLEGKLSTERLMYGGAMVRSEEFPTPAVVTIPSGRFEAVRGADSPLETIVIQPDMRVHLVQREPLSREGADLSSARRIVSVGMGVSKREDMALVEDLAAALGAQIGCTRGIAEERGWVPVEHYVGISGVSVAPDLYLAVGISGQVQHMVGVRDAKVIVAIDKNEKAPIFRETDFGIVGDLYALVPLLTDALGAVR
jgi:electron transfer flavoprotein alpha subunit